MQDTSKYTRNSIKGLYEESDIQLARKFLVKKNKDKITIDTIADEVDKYKNLENPDGTKKYPKISALPNVDYSYFVYQIFMKYDILCRDVNKYDLNIEAFVNYYEKILTENWNIFDTERLELDRQFLRLDKRRNRTPQANVYMFNSIADAVKLIDLTKISGYNFNI